jgi:hypothetical protein
MWYVASKSTSGLREEVGKKSPRAIFAAAASILKRKKFGNSLSCAARRGGSDAVFRFAIPQTVAELKMKNAFTSVH